MLESTYTLEGRGRAFADFDLLMGSLKSRVSGREASRDGREDAGVLGMIRFCDLVRWRSRILGLELVFSGRGGSSPSNALAGARGLVVTLGSSTRDAVGTRHTGGRWLTSNLLGGEGEGAGEVCMPVETIVALCGEGSCIVTGGDRTAAAG